MPITEIVFMGSLHPILPQKIPRGSIKTFVLTTCNVCGKLHGIVEKKQSKNLRVYCECDKTYKPNIDLFILFNIEHIKSVILIQCEVCTKFHGTVEETYNGTVSVYCECDLLKDPLVKTCCICVKNKDNDIPKIIWMPMTDNIEADGKLRHNPRIEGMAGW